MTVPRLPALLLRASLLFFLPCWVRCSAGNNDSRFVPVAKVGRGAIWFAKAKQAFASFGPPVLLWLARMPLLFPREVRTSRWSRSCMWWSSGQANGAGPPATRFETFSRWLFAVDWEPAGLCPCPWMMPWAPIVRACLLLYCCIVVLLRAAWSPKTQAERLERFS